MHVLWCTCAHVSLKVATKNYFRDRKTYESLDFYVICLEQKRKGATEIPGKITISEFIKVIRFHISAGTLTKSRASPRVLSWEISEKF